MLPKKVAIIDYHLSNIFSVKHACEFERLDAEITSDASSLKDADGVILPGVGAFGDAMKNLKKLDLIKGIKEFVESGKPLMGICLGMQLLFGYSEEFGNHEGLNLIEGTVKKFPTNNKKGELIKIPHMGWNKIYKAENRNNLWKKTILENVANNEFMYFVHSYYVQPKDIKLTLALTNYEGIEYCSAIMKNNIFAVQFHPEKSGKRGLEIYHNFANLINKKNG